MSARTVLWWTISLWISFLFERLGGERQCQDTRNLISCLVNTKIMEINKGFGYKRNCFNIIASVTKLVNRNFILPKASMSISNPARSLIPSQLNLFEGHSSTSRN